MQILYRFFLVYSLPEQREKAFIKLMWTREIQMYSTFDGMVSGIICSNAGDWRVFMNILPNDCFVFIFNAYLLLITYHNSC